MKLTMRDKIILLLVVACVCAWGGYKTVFTPMQNKIVSLEAEKETAKGLLTDITPLIKEAEKLTAKEKDLKNRIETIKSSDLGKTATNEELLVYIGNSTARHNVNVTGFNNLGLTVENDVYKMLIDMELKGKGNDINNVLKDIESMGVKYSVGSVSYRQNEQYDYLKRFYDYLTDLPWYEEPDEEEIEEFNKQNQEDIGIGDIIGEDVFVPDTFYPVPDTEIPDVLVPDTVPEISPVPESPKSIDERLDQLLELMSFRYGNTGYELMLLTDNNYEYKEGQDMRLAITLCFIMFDEPASGNSIVFETENEDYGVL
ncbi:MAG: hypothetical protein KIG39_05535 [Lachnospiraceae bacterium]|nr:hypothetical protein [Lachnospiraceae bacterium]